METTYLDSEEGLKLFLDLRSTAIFGESDVPIRKMLALYIDQLTNKTVLDHQLEIMSIISEASTSALGARYFIDEGVAATVIGLLASPFDKIVGLSATALQNMLQHDDSRNSLVEMGVLVALVNAAEKHQDNSAILVGILESVASIYRRKSRAELSWCEVIVKILTKSLYSEHPGILKASLRAFSYLSEGTPNWIENALRTGILIRVLELVSAPDETLSIFAIRVIGNIVTGDDYQTQRAVDCNAITFLTLIFSRLTDKGSRKEVAWALSNICAGSAQQIEECIQAGVVPVALQCAASEEPDIVHEAIWLLANICVTGREGPRMHLLSFDVMELFVRLLNDCCAGDNNRQSVLMDGMDALLNVGDCAKDRFTACGGVETLLKRQKMGVNDATRLLNKHFPGSVGDEEHAYW